MKNNEIKLQKGYELVRDHIQNKIQNGTYASGEKLPSVTELSIHYGVGRSTVREALSALKAMGWLDIRQGGGTFVRNNISTHYESAIGELFRHTLSLTPLLQVRKILEVGCASLAAKERTLEDIKSLEQILDLMKQHPEEDETVEQADVQFHLQLSKATHNELLISMMESLTERLQETMKNSRRLWYYANSSTSRHLLEEHESILEAIKRQDEQEAGDRMRKHLEKVESVLLSDENKRS